MGWEKRDKKKIEQMGIGDRSKHWCRILVYVESSNGWPNTRSIYIQIPGLYIPLNGAVWWYQSMSMPRTLKSSIFTFCVVIITDTLINITEHNHDDPRPFRSLLCFWTQNEVYSGESKADGQNICSGGPHGKKKSKPRKRLTTRFFFFNFHANWKWGRGSK